MQKPDMLFWRRGLAALCAVAFVLSTLPLYLITFANHPYYDDYGFSSEVHQAWQESGSLKAVFKAAWRSAHTTRSTWQGNYTGTLLSNLQPGLFSEKWYGIGAVFLLTVLIGCFAFFFATVFERLGLQASERISLSCLALMVMLQFMPDVGEAFYWFNGGVGNVFVYSLLALASALTMRLLCTPGRGVGLTFALLMLCVLLGGGSYGGGLFGLCLCAVTLAWLFWKKHAKRWAFLLISSVFAVCFLYSMSAPGNAVRAGVIAYDSSAVKAVVQALYYGTAQIGTYLRLPVISITLLLWPALYEAARNSSYAFRHPWLMLGLGVGLYCTQLVPPLYAGVFIGGGRIVNTYFLSFVVLWLLYAYYLAGVIARHVQISSGLTVRGFGALVLVSLCLFGIGSLSFKRTDDLLYGVQNLSGPSAALSLLTGDAARYDREMTQREQLLNDKSQLVVTLAPLSTVPAVFPDDLLVPDAVYDVRPSLCMYYGKQAILLEGEVAP